MKKTQPPLRKPPSVKICYFRPHGNTLQDVLDEIKGAIKEGASPKTTIVKNREGDFFYNILQPGETEEEYNIRLEQYRKDIEFTPR